MRGMFNQYTKPSAWNNWAPNPQALINEMFNPAPKCCQYWFALDPETNCLAFMFSLNSPRIYHDNAKDLAVYLIANQIPCMIGDGGDLIFTNIKMKKGVVNIAELKQELKEQIDRIQPKSDDFERKNFFR